MTHRRTLATIGLTVAAALLHTAPLVAQQPATPPAPPTNRNAPPLGPARRGPATLDDRVARMTAELGLNAEQAAKVRTVFAAQERTQDSVLARRAAAQDAERAAMLAMHTNAEKALAGILTSDQKLKHDAARARRGGPPGFGRADGAMRRGGRRGGAAPHRNDRWDDRRGGRGDRRGPPDADGRTGR